MAFLLIRHRVADFSRWKSAFEDHRRAREEAGLEDVHLWRDLNDPAEVILLFRTDDVDRARTFGESEDLRHVMQDAGVIGAPQMLFLQEEDLKARRRAADTEPRAPGP